MLPTRACYRNMEGDVQEGGTRLGASEDGSYGKHFYAHTWR